MYSRRRFICLIAPLLALAACTPPSPSSVAIQPFKVTASIQDLMQSVVDPSADDLWESVETVVDKKGTRSRQPRTDAEWKAVRALAIRLAESANLLAIEGRPVVHEGKHLEDSHVADILTASAIEAKINADRGAFISRARALQASAELALAAIDARDAKQLVVAGGHIDTACEQCHLAYWYPNDKRPTSVPQNR